MIEHDNLSVGGASTYWSLGAFTSLESLRRGFEAAGFEERVPKERPASACLRDALSQVFRGHRCDVKRLKDEDAFEVVQTAYGDMAAGNLYTPLLRAKAAPGGQIRVRWVNPNIDPSLFEGHILEAYNAQLGYLRPQQVAEAMVNVLGALRGVKLRPTGGFYWLSSGNLGRWQKVGAAVERSAVGCRHSVYLLRHKMDADALRAVRDAITEEVEAEAQRIEKEVEDPASTLGDKALQARKAQALALREKVKDYEAILGEALAGLGESCERAHDAAARAALLASVAEVA